MNCLYNHIFLFFFQLIEWGGPTLINGTIFFWGLLFSLSLTVQEPTGFIQSHRIGSSSTHQVHSWVIQSVPSFLLLLFSSVQYSVGLDDGIPWCCRLLFCCHQFIHSAHVFSDYLLCARSSAVLQWDDKDDQEKQTSSLWSLHSNRKAWWKTRKPKSK